MPALRETGVALTMAEEPAHWPISVARFSEMVRLGIIGGHDPVNLWQGRLVERPLPTRPHAIALTAGYLALIDLLPENVGVESQQPLAFRREASVIQPDLMVLRGRSTDFRREFPTTADISLLGEVADRTLSEDRKFAHLYAAEGIPVYWIVNIPDRRIEVYAGPSAEGYAVCTLVGPDDELPVVVDGREVGWLRGRKLMP